MQRDLPKKYGDQTETLATAFLEQEGLLIVERNYYARKLGEIDIIAKQEDVLRFIEVKSGRSEFDLSITLLRLNYEKLSILELLHEK